MNAFPVFHEALRGRQAVPAAIATVLSWLMMSDGDANPREIGYIESFRSARGIDAELMTEITEIGRLAPAAELAHSIEILSTLLNDEGKWLLLDLVLGMVLADGRIHFAEKVIIEVVVDALGLSTFAFRERYKEVTGRSYKSAGDVSSARWWSQFETRQRKKQRERAQDDREQQFSSKGNRAQERRQALTILGLDENAAQADVVDAFRRLAKVHHPDRFHTLGAEAQRAAHETFIRIKNAYDMLRAA